MKKVRGFIIEIWAGDCPDCGTVNYFGALDGEPPFDAHCRDCGTEYTVVKPDPR